MSRQLTIAWLTTLLIGTPLPAWALMVERTLPERVQEADVIAAGTVVSQRSYEQPFHGIRMFYTEVTIQVDRFAKGGAGAAGPATVVLRVPGGTVGTERMTVSDMPTFQQGERVVVLGKRLNAQRSRLVNGRLGKFRLVRDPQSKLEMVMSDIGQPLSVTDLQALHMPVQTPQAVPAGAFLQRLEELAHE
ncbi:MAG: hypothetical protein HY597_07275 [Candidatus Omnitrophica bacterium]|nr:hypothetical protein [Candidatus Omnitrophota bacterium]